jgi:hypothetical protein
MVSTTTVRQAAVAMVTRTVPVSGARAREIGPVMLQLQPKGREAVAEQIQYLAVWKRQPGGAWWPSVDVWNANAERDDAIPARCTRLTSGSHSR